MAVFASEGSAIAQNPQMLLHLLPPLALFFTGNLLLAFVVSRWLASGYENFVSLSDTILARNSPTALLSQILLWIGRKGLFIKAACAPAGKQVAGPEEKEGKPDIRRA